MSRAPRCAAVRSMLIIGVIPTPPAIITKPAPAPTSLVKAPCGPSTQTGEPGGRRRNARVKSPAWRIVNSVVSMCALEAIVKGCSSAVTDRSSRIQANWPGAKAHEFTGGPCRLRRGSSTSVLTVEFSRRTSRTRNSVDASNIGRHAQRYPKIPTTSAASSPKRVPIAGTATRWSSHHTCNADSVITATASATWSHRHSS